MNIFFKKRTNKTLTRFVLYLLWLMWQCIRQSNRLNRLWCKSTGFKSWRGSNIYFLMGGEKHCAKLEVKKDLFLFIIYCSWYFSKEGIRNVNKRCKRRFNMLGGDMGVPPIFVPKLFPNLREYFFLGRLHLSVPKNQHVLPKKTNMFLSALQTKHHFVHGPWPI